MGFQSRLNPFSFVSPNLLRRIIPYNIIISAIITDPSVNSKIKMSFLADYISKVTDFIVWHSDCLTIYRLFETIQLTKGN